MKEKKVIILHEYGAPSHYIGLESFLDNSPIYENPQYKEFSILRRYLRSFKDMNFSLFIKTTKNMLWLVYSFLYPRTNSGKIVILGMAPLDWRVIILSRVLKFSTVIYHSSWTDWSGNNYPKRNYFFKKKIEKKWRYFLSAQAKAIACVTSITCNEILNFTANECLATTKVVYHSFNDNFLKVDVDKQHLNSNGDTLNIIFVGRLVRQKGIDKIIELSEIFPNHNFTLVGDGELYKELKHLNKGNVFLKGFVSSKDELMTLCAEHDVILLPSLRIDGWEELFGISLIEAMAAGCVPLVTDHMGPKEILCSDKLLEEFIFKEENYVNDAACYIDKFAKNKKYLVDMKLASIKCARRFSLEEIGARWESIFHFLAKKTKD